MEERIKELMQSGGFTLIGGFEKKVAIQWADGTKAMETTAIGVARNDDGGITLRQYGGLDAGGQITCAVKNTIHLGPEHLAALER